MNLDPFGHVDAARHFLEARRRELAAAKKPECKEFWRRAIAKSEARIKEMEKCEIDYWKNL